ncbi:MAG: hypothetical protein A2287_05505 [Candidatus Melainabacteria bacterium RIFOXYA12_FULL_32_12]|nr:MAG: hypothetical protein A2255_04170 [Candidatus Melainabacteria bacterium RIFOXYA2_FULL_32_9]OGI30981.1 MAG: hypothetical protein A2287_05505 [Candidatus Melainabacteria bacterium RIFOXYA12_FULL_32_12]
MSIPPIQPSGWNSQVNPPSSVENQGGGSGSAGYMRKEEKIDEATFHTNENKQDELILLQNKSLLTIIREFFTSLWIFILKTLGIRATKES